MVKTVKITTDNEISILELSRWDIFTIGAAIGADCTEGVKTQRMADLFRDSIVMIVDESGKIKNRPDNQVASILYGVDMHGCTITGDVIFAVRRGPDYLPPENPELLKFFLKDHFPILREAKEGEESASMKIVVSERKRGKKHGSSKGTGSEFDKQGEQ